MNWKKLEIRVEDLKITLILQKGMFLLILLFKRVLKSSYNLLKNGKTITKSFFSTVNVTDFSASLIEKVFDATIYQFDRKFVFLIFHLNDILLNQILKNPKQLKPFQIIKWESNQLYILQK